MTTNKNSMLHWFPLVEDLQIPQPETKMVPVPNGALGSLAMVDDQSTIPGYYTIESVLDHFLPFPVFMRTDMSSQKEKFRKTCRVPNKRALFPHILEIVSSNVESGLEDAALVFRKWLDLDAGFSAFDGLPIATEARIHLEDGSVHSIVPYWSESDIVQPTSSRWQEILEYQNKTVTEYEWKLQEYSVEIGNRFPAGKWTADFAMGRDGEWYLIDMGHITQRW